MQDCASTCDFPDLARILERQVGNDGIRVVHSSMWGRSAAFKVLGLDGEGMRILSQPFLLSRLPL